MKHPYYDPFRITLVALACGLAAWMLVATMLWITWRAVR